MTYTINLRITAKNREQLESAIASGRITETFLNAASGENDSVELIDPSGNILFERTQRRKNARNFDNWRYKVIKGYRNRAMKFEAEAPTVADKLAWNQVVRWFKSILEGRYLNKSRAISIPPIKPKETNDIWMKVDLCPFYAGDYCRNVDNKEGVCRNFEYTKCNYFIKSYPKSSEKLALYQEYEKLPLKESIYKEHFKLWLSQCLYEFLQIKQPFSIGATVDTYGITSFAQHVQFCKEVNEWFKTWFGGFDFFEELMKELEKVEGNG